MTEYYGWQVPALFTSVEGETEAVRSGAGVADLSWLARFEVKGKRLSDELKMPRGAQSWTLAPRHVLLTCEPPVREQLVQVLRSSRPVASDAVSLRSLYWTEKTSVYAQLLLAGPRSRDVLGKLTSLNVSESALPNLGCARSSLAHTHAIILRDDLETLPAFHLLVSREYAEHVWQGVLHAGLEFKLMAFGLEAQRVLIRQ